MANANGQREAAAVGYVPNGNGKGGRLIIPPNASVAQISSWAYEAVARNQGFQAAKFVARQAETLSKTHRDGNEQSVQRQQSKKSQELSI